jgi:hypothetical protein
MASGTMEDPVVLKPRMVQMLAALDVFLPINDQRIQNELIEAIFDNVEADQYFVIQGASHVLLYLGFDRGIEGRYKTNFTPYYIQRVDTGKKTPIYHPGEPPTWRDYLKKTELYEAVQGIYRQGERELGQLKQVRDTWGFDRALDRFNE